MSKNSDLAPAIQFTGMMMAECRNSLVPGPACAVTANKEKPYMDSMHEIVEQAFHATAAKYQWGTDYPWFLDERGKKAVDVLRRGLADKAIWNVDLKEAVFTLTRDYEETVRKAEEINDVSFYRIFNSLSQLHTVNTLIRSCEKFLKKPEVPDYYFSSRDYDDQAIKSPQDITKFQEKHIKEILIPGVRNMIPILRAWADVQEMRVQLKPLVKMGRKQVGEGKPVYVPPPQAAESLKKVDRILRDLIEGKRTELENMVAGTLQRIIDHFFKTHEKMSARDFFRNRPEAARLIEEVVDKPDDYYRDWSKAKPSKDAKKIVAKKAKASADAVVLNYATKNMAKLTRLVAEKQNSGVGFTDVEDQGMSVRGDTFAGRMKFEFDDGSGFTVLNQMVLKTSPRGLLFAQFPTTFHLVKSSDGTTRAKLSEKQMNEEWLGA